jgi:predicted TIM-barrel fold metal-dependent hydrolase
LKIDFHCHAFPGEVLQALNAHYPDRIQLKETPKGKLYVVPAGPALPAWDEGIRIKDIDAVGVDIELLSCPVVYMSLDGHLPGLCRTVNDALARSCRLHPDRFKAFVHVPFNDRRAALEEMSRCLDQLGFIGAIIPSSINGRYLDEPEFDWFWEETYRRGVPVFLHPSILSCVDRVLELLSRPFESTVAAARLVCRGLYDRFPELVLVVSHLGGALPFLAHRVDLGFEMPVPAGSEWEISKPPSEHMRKLYVDTAMGWSPAAFRCARELVGIDHLVFGTDYFIPGARFMERILDVLEKLDISAAERQKIFHENAARILKLR